MKTVILDSSNTKLGVGVADENKVLDFVYYEAWQQQSEFMIPELDKLLNKFNVSKDEIGSIVVSIGPGSYTGVRIAITIAKVLALATNATVYPVSALQILLEKDKPSICLINARSSRSYIGVYQNDKVLLADQIMTNEEVKKYIADHSEYAICGDTKYLGFEGFEANVIENMFELKNKLSPLDNYLALKPVYMKD